MIVYHLLTSLCKRIVYRSAKGAHLRTHQEAAEEICVSRDLQERRHHPQRRLLLLRAQLLLKYNQNKVSLS